MGCTRDRNVERGTKGFRVRKTGLSSTLVKLRDDQWLQVSYLSWARGSYERWNSHCPIYQGDSWVCTTCAILERCARLASLALLAVVAHRSRDPCMRDVWGAPRPMVLRACEASDPAGHYIGVATSFDKRTSIYLLLLYRGTSFSVTTPRVPYKITIRSIIS